MKTVIHWFRRDLRVSDNTALSEAVRRAERVVPVFILEDAFRTGPDVGAARLAFLLQSMESLRKNLTELGYPLIVRNGKSEQVLPRLCQEIGAQAVFANKRYEPYAQARDSRVFNALNAVGIGFELFKDAVVWEEAEILTQAGKPYTVFTPYSRAWKGKAMPGPKSKLRSQKSEVSTQKIPTDPLPSDSGELGHRRQLPVVRRRTPTPLAARTRQIDSSPGSPKSGHETRRTRLSTDRCGRQRR